MKEPVKKQCIFYTYVYLFEAALNARATIRRVADGQNYHRISAVLFAAFAVEAQLNEIGMRVFDFWDSIERGLPWRGKLDLIADKLSIKLDKGQRPYQTVVDMFDFRNRIAHGKTNIQSVAALQDADNGDGDPVWLNKYWNDLAVDRVIDDTRSLLNDLLEASGITDHTINTIGTSETTLVPKSPPAT